MFTRDNGDFRNGDFARNVKELRNFAKINSDKNCYLAPNPSTSTMNVRHSAEDVSHWSFFLIDVDPVCMNPAKHGKKCNTCWKKAAPALAMDFALLWLGEWLGRDFNKQKPIIIDSGRGMQAWVRLGDVELDEHTRRTARRVNGYWLSRLDEKMGTMHGCRIDTSVSDLPRLMRMPGTRNIKTKRVADFVEPSAVVFSGLESLLVTGTPPNRLVEPAVGEVKPGRSWKAVFPELTRMAQQYLTLGKEEPGRHETVWHTVKKLHEVGVTKEETRKAITRANALRGEDEALEPIELENALKTVYKD